MKPTKSHSFCADRVHDYPHLVKRWRRVAASRKLILHVLIEAGGFPIYYLETRAPNANHPWLYCSAGIHGDEPAGPEALIQWAEKSKNFFRYLNVFIFPCLNPWGLVNNQRYDVQGNDLNRTYHHDGIPQTAQTAAQRQILVNRKFDLALFLHEDYDARGVYIYEIPFKLPLIADQFIAESSAHIPPDPRSVIEGTKARGGLIQRKLDRKSIRLLSSLAPEAFFFHSSLNCHSLTIETPSEFHIDQRVAAHVAILQYAAEYCCSLTK